MIKFSIITVTYNSGDKLSQTLNNILEQKYDSFEVIVKDGLSTDNSLDSIPNDPRIKIFSEIDEGIYDAMNQAVKHADGDYYVFMNCGDFFYKNDVLLCVNDEIMSDKECADLYYGDVYVSSRNGIIVAPNYLDDYTLITRTLCHQCIFFAGKIFDTLNFDYNTFGLAADMGLYVRCLKKEHMKLKHMNIIVCNYEGRGTSETVSNKKKIIASKKIIINSFYTKQECLKVKLKKIIKLQYLKEIIGSTKLFFNVYEKIASFMNKRQAEQYDNK